MLLLIGLVIGLGPYQGAGSKSFSCNMLFSILQDSLFSIWLNPTLRAVSLCSSFSPRADLMEKLLRSEIKHDGMMMKVK